MLKQLRPESPCFAAAAPHAATPPPAPPSARPSHAQVLTGVGLGHRGGRGGGGGGGGLRAGGGGRRRRGRRAAGGGGGGPHGLGLGRQHGRQLCLLDDLDPVGFAPRRLARARVVEIDLGRAAP